MLGLESWENGGMGCWGDGEKVGELSLVIGHWSLVIGNWGA
jgi:hypothetical protein